MNPIRCKLAVALRAARAAIGWTQSEVANHLRLPRQGLPRMERALQNISADYLLMLVNFYAERGVKIIYAEESSVRIEINDKALACARQLLEEKNK